MTKGHKGLVIDLLAILKTNVEALTALSRASCIKLYKNIAQSRLFCRIAKRSIVQRPCLLLVISTPRLANQSHDSVPLILLKNKGSMIYLLFYPCF